MSKNRLSLVGFALFLLIGASAFWWTTMKWTGELNSLRPHFDGQCESVEGIVGAEDIVIDHEKTLAYISSHDRRNRETRGAIWVMPLGAPQEARKMDMTGYNADLFSPHGIDLWVGEDGSRRLFVIEHGDWSQSRIIIFRIEDGTLVFDHAVTDPLIKRPNDVAAAGKDAFYTSNDLGTPYGGKGEFLEVLFRQQKGNLIYFDGQKARIAADKIGYANGVKLSHDGKTLYLGAIIDQSVRLYDRDLNTGALRLRDEIPLYTGVDNIDVDEDGVLWVGAHPKLLTFSKHAKDAAVRSPSQILRIDPKVKSIKEAYLSLGDPLSGASVGAHHNGTLVMGGVFDPRVLVCRLGSELNDVPPLKPTPSE
ncbi:MAG: hypothetical protein COA84_02200 [Robiginitomaculum sp.]|nr:MAG: hypothetical protein COA84_02200 [Robiginitomaculum sp.]